MRYIRPETRAFFWRWREVLIGLAILVWGGWLVATSLGLIAVFGWILIALGAVTVFTGVQRTRFRIGTGGAGVVQVDEREVIYFGPLEGGTVSIEALTLVELHPFEGGAHRWVLTEPGRHPLSIPTDAEHSETLFDAFGALKGFETQRMLHALNTLSPHPIVIWQKEPRQLH
ncbi:hypothetical protein JI58_09140 [Marinosulfonomonas sp. PRT-SC04]|nr:hypothetical protein JI58_09140 [Marinosulfonomonas sp. PRT-SC04]